MGALPHRLNVLRFIGVFKKKFSKYGVPPPPVKSQKVLHSLKPNTNVAFLILIYCYDVINKNVFRHKNGHAWNLLCNSGASKYVAVNCLNFIENRLKVPYDVTDSIFILQCPGNERIILNKVRLKIVLLHIILLSNTMQDKNTSLTTILFTQTTFTIC